MEIYIYREYFYNLYFNYKVDFEITKNIEVSLNGKEHGNRIRTIYQAQIDLDNGNEIIPAQVNQYCVNLLPIVFC